MISRKDLREFRKEKNLTQRQFAKILRVTENYISLMESGAKPVSSRILQKIANKFGEVIRVTVRPK